MNVFFKGTKENNCYHDFVEDPSNRKKMRAFNKMFGSSLAEESVKLHRRIKQYDTVADYNKVYGSTANRIETLSGIKDKDPFILKVRVTGAYRKFFYHIVDVENLSFLKKKEWVGQFDSVSDIYVIEINNHDYKSVQ